MPLSIYSIVMQIVFQVFFSNAKFIMIIPNVVNARTTDVPRVYCFIFVDTAKIKQHYEYLTSILSALIIIGKLCCYTFTS